MWSYRLPPTPYYNNATKYASLTHIECVIHNDLVYKLICVCVLAEMDRDNKQKGRNMAPEPNQNPNPGGNPPGGNPPTPPSGDIDVSKLSQEQLNKVLEDPRLWKSERLTELREAQKKLKKLEEDQAAADKKKLEEEGKLKELLDLTKGELDKAKAQIGELTISSAIEAAAVAKGFVDPKVAAKLIDRSKIATGEDGTVSGLEEALTALATTSPYLVGTKPPGSPMPPSNPGNQPGSAPGTFTVSQIGDPAFYQANRDAIMKAQAEGKIVDDRNPFGGTPQG